ncbi:hypothetical protein GO013_04905 [Pseudodesulfovibrio sp. JC047]|uniref:helix-turn-helix domain-containing protein n=1 Tax=Pseudodesulfovibrio sp. JC047 TaxID=2683199 RepID=UPI0013D2249E|nr:helix-turn-helix domain-containing protein [Pseudodesulfovibrio sp. JC047]NDV18757.1 hypothetical protein [Pseudodesulfovibrio sp. JC047]
MLMKKEKGVENAGKQVSTPLIPQLNVDGNIIYLPARARKDQAPAFVHLFIPLPWFGPKILDVIRENNELSLPERAILRELVICAGQDGRCFPGQKYLSKKIGICERTVRNGLSNLRSKGFVVWKNEAGMVNSYYCVFHSSYLTLPRQTFPHTQEYIAAPSGKPSSPLRQTLLSNSLSNDLTEKPKETISDPCFSSLKEQEVNAVGEMIRIVSNTKDSPKMWARATAKAFANGSGCLKSLKKQYDEALVVAHRDKEKSQWDLLIKKCLENHGFEKFLKDMKALTNSIYVTVDDVDIPHVYIESFLKNIGEK